MTYIRKGDEFGKRKKKGKNPSVEYYSCRTEHITESAIQEGWALAHFVRSTIHSFDLKHIHTHTHKNQNNHQTNTSDLRL